jgi:two-component system, chemotaxis family, protein-glutamate methylesterase/glutaminase
MTRGPDRPDPPLRVLVVDDSAYNRRSIAETLSTSPEVAVVGKAADGEEALRLVAELKPQAITLDLEMPRMDGFTFLRILMGKFPTPVIVVSSYSHKENVFKALELGAIDFVAKPDKYADVDLQQIRQELLSKVLLVRSLRPSAVVARAPMESRDVILPASGSVIPPRHLVAIASSTGGPTALLEIVAGMPAVTSSALLLAQHMPAKFTTTFAERLNRRSALRVSEAQDLDAVVEGSAFVCPGSKCMELEAGAGRGELRLRVVPPDPSERYVPSADRLFLSVARAVGNRAVGVVLTGMGEDGVQGARAIVAAGGVVVVESERTAVVHGMPGAVLRAGIPQRTLTLPEIVSFLADLGS